MADKVAFIGLGIMGYPMAGHLKKAGYDVAAFNRTRKVVDRWVKEFGGEPAATPADAAMGASAIFVCVGNDDDVRAVVAGPDGAFDGMEAGAVLVDHTTTSAAVAQELAAIGRERSLGFVDAPVSGGQAGAENGALTVMAGGAQSDFDRVAPFVNAYARSLKLMGDVGAGQLTKMVNQICIAGIVQGLSEGIHFAEKAGLDPAKVIEVISKGAAQSWQMENRYKTMINREFEFGFAVDWMRKDLGICLDAARDRGAKVPLAALVDQFYADVQAMGGARWDTSSLITRLDDRKAR
jgi:3-hydroxyisobutyrate dehydrogenase